MATLYRKYRPQTFESLIGQPTITKTLQAELASGAIAHAYLFVGPRGVGKTTTARIFAKAVNCASPKKKGIEPDNSCVSCEAMNHGRSLDLIEIDAASHTQVDHVRENILPAARTAPTTGKYKVFIIDEVHMLSISAFNALLKMLEEPPTHVIFILATTEPHRVPETIISRCQRFDFHRVATSDMVSRLRELCREESCSADDAVLQRIARAADGSQRDAESILGQLIGLGEKKLTDALADMVLPRSNFHAVLDLVSAVNEQRITDALTEVQELVDAGIRIPYFMRECIELLRSLLLLKLGMTSALPPLSSEDTARATTLVGALSIQQLTAMVEVFISHERDGRLTSIPQLPLELALVELATNQTGSVPGDQRPSGRSTGSTMPHTRPTDSKRGTTSLASTEIIQQWPVLLAKIAESHPSVAVLLKTATPCDIVDGVLSLSFPYAFHSERILDARNKPVIESALSSILGTPITIDTTVKTLEETPQLEQTTQSTPEAANQPVPSGDVWEQALKSFGGSLVSEGGAPPT